MNKNKHSKERFEHRRGSKLGDGKRFDSIQAENRARIRLRVPEAIEADDTVEGVLYQAISSGLNLTDKMQTMLNTDGLFEKDRFRKLIIQAIEVGNIKVLSELSMLSVFNTMRIRMMEQERYFHAFGRVNSELAVELQKDDSELIMLDQSMLSPNEEMTQQFRRLVKNGQIVLYDKLTVEGINFSIYRVADK